MRLLKRLLLWTSLLLAVLLLSGLLRAWYVFRDRLPDYSLDLAIAPTAAPQPLRAGFGRVQINPDLSDPQRPVWLAGFSQHRAATAIHDDLEAVSCVLDDGSTRIGIVALDAIGFFNDDVVRVRRKCAEKLDLDYVMVCSTHNHSTPDLLGLWGPNFFRTGVDPKYREQVIAGVVKALEMAVGSLAPARMQAALIKAPTEGLVADTRQPHVFDPDIHLLKFVEPDSGRVLGSVVNWANHPETVWSRNTEVTADFCGYLRNALERGVQDGEAVLAAGVGGTHVYVNGAVGGLISTTPKVPVRDPFLNQEFKEPSHEKARAVGHCLAALILPELRNTKTSVAPDQLPSIGVRARTFFVPVENRLYLLASFLGLIDRGHTGWKRLRTEASLVTIGDVSLACVPGEIYPEIVNGGVEHPPGADFDAKPQEVPPLREIMPGRVKFVLGLANDELGYLIPQSQWDTRAPFTYGRDSAPYGEINSCGPRTGSLVHAMLADLCGSAKP